MMYMTMERISGGYAFRTINSEGVADKVRVYFTNKREAISRARKYFGLEHKKLNIISI